LGRVLERKIFLELVTYPRFHQRSLFTDRVIVYLGEEGEEDDIDDV
jgi:hypothetical protein